jgi:hypothetical protein
MSSANKAFPDFLSNVLEFTFGEVLNYSEKMVSHNDSNRLPLQWCLFYATLRFILMIFTLMGITQ